MTTSGLGAGCRRFVGRCALITGGSSGIGQASAYRLGLEGAAVFITGRDPQRLEKTVDDLRAQGVVADFFSADLGNREAAHSVCRRARTWSERSDILVNAAGIFKGVPFEEMTSEEWDETIDVDLSSVMRMSHAWLTELSRDSGVIVNVSSINALIGDAASQCAHYAAAKAGVLALSRQLAVELAPSIRVVSVTPGAVDTPILTGWLEDPEERRAWFERFVPLGRIAHPSEVAAAIAFLASDDASYITGESLSVDGGMAFL